MSKVTLHIIIILLMASLPSCNRGAREQAETMRRYSDIEISAQVGTRKIFYRFPAPNDIINYIKTEKLKFHKEYLNPVSWADMYIDPRLQLFNLGVYTANFAYITVFETLTEATEYFWAIELLAYKTGLSSVFTRDMRTRVQDNQSNIDSLSQIARDSYNAMVHHLTANGNEKQLAIISAGGYVEVIYLAVQQTDDIQADFELLRKIYDQRYGLENLIDFMNDFTDDPWIETLQSDLKHILDAFYLVEERIVDETRATTDSKSGLRFSGGRVKLSLSTPSYQELKGRVVGIRGKYTDPKSQVSQ